MKLDRTQTRNGILLALLAAGMGAFLMGAYGGARVAEKEPVVAEEKGPTEVPAEKPVITTVVDGVGCVMKDDMVFDKSTWYVTITLVCDVDILFQYLPAVEQ